MVIPFGTPPITVYTTGGFYWDGEITISTSDVEITAADGAVATLDCTGKQFALKITADRVNMTRFHVTGCGASTVPPVQILSNDNTFTACDFNAAVSATTPQDSFGFGGVVRVKGNNNSFRACHFTNGYLRAARMAYGGGLFIEGDGTTIDTCLFSANRAAVDTSLLVINSVTPDSTQGWCVGGI
jgi:hypothetical protein